MLSLAYMCTLDIFVLIDYTSYIQNLNNLGILGVFFYLRWKKPELERPIKVRLNLKYQVCTWEFYLILTREIIFYFRCQLFIPLYFHVLRYSWLYSRYLIVQFKLA